MDVVILDHHNVAKTDKKLNAILVNPNQEGCKYKNKYISGSGVVFRFIELLDYNYKKVRINNYLDLVATSLLSDQMRMDSMENRYFVKKGLSNICNVGLLALINATKNSNKELNASIMNYSIIPILNTTTRNNEMHKAFRILREEDYFKAKKMAEWLVKENEERKEKVKHLFEEYESIMQDEAFVLVTKNDAKKNYNGLVAQKFASEYMKPSLILKDDGESYQGSYRSYNNFDLQTFLRECPYVEYAEGHSPAGGCKITHENWDKFKKYINENIDRELFKPTIHYDLSLNEEDITTNLVEDVMKFDLIYGNGSPQITVKIDDIFIHERGLFPKDREKHVKLKSDKLEIMKFNDPIYAEEVGEFDVVSIIGTLNINEWNKKKTIQLFVNDYKLI